MLDFTPPLTPSQHSPTNSVKLSIGVEKDSGTSSSSTSSRRVNSGPASINEAFNATTGMSESMKSSRMGLVLVTGGTGFVASHIVQQLILRGYPVRTTVRRKKKTSDTTSPTADEGDEDQSESNREIGSLFRPFVHVTNIHRMLEVVEADLLYDHPLNEAYLKNPDKEDSTNTRTNSGSGKERDHGRTFSKADRNDSTDKLTNSTRTGSMKDRPLPSPPSKDVEVESFQVENDQNKKKQLDKTLAASSPTWDGYSDWKEVFAGVSYVIHVASPYVLSPDTPEGKKELMDVSIEGTRRILSYCQASKTVKTLVLTSCTHALSNDFDSRRVYNEDDWNKDASLNNHIYAFR